MGGRVCGQAIDLAAIYLREEPDALRSARPGLCGGHRATGVPTAIVNLPYLARLNNSKSSRNLVHHWTSRRCKRKVSTKQKESLQCGKRLNKPLSASFASSPLPRSSAPVSNWETAATPIANAGMNTRTWSIEDYSLSPRKARLGVRSTRSPSALSISSVNPTCYKTPPLVTARKGASDDP